MKFIQQLNNTDFIVRFDLETYNTKRDTQLTIAHDYVQFSGNSIVCTKLNIFGPLHQGVVTNTLHVPNRIQIPIKMFGGAILPIIQEHEFMEEEHWSTYNYQKNLKFTYYKDNARMICITDDDNKVHHIPLSLYDTIKNSK